MFLLGPAVLPLGFRSSLGSRVLIRSYRCLARTRRSSSPFEFMRVAKRHRIKETSARLCCRPMHHQKMEDLIICGMTCHASCARADRRCRRIRENDSSTRIDPDSGVLVSPVVFCNVPAQLNYKTRHTDVRITNACA